MKNLSFLFAFALLFTMSCNDDDGGISLDVDDLTIRLSWNQADADLDLDLSLPNNTFIGSGSTQHSGDVLSGPGEEVITLDDEALDGAYIIQVEWFSGAGDVSYQLTVESQGTSRTFDADIDAIIDIDLINFTKTGGTLSF
ncbi:MAG: hypothetical protein AAF433_00110 [Bacteroidota bacterium]